MKKSEKLKKRRNKPKNILKMYVCNDSVLKGKEKKSNELRKKQKTKKVYKQK